VNPEITIRPPELQTFSGALLESEMALPYAMGRHHSSPAPVSGHVAAVAFHHVGWSSIKWNA